MLKVGFISLGCPKNFVDSEVMRGNLLRAEISEAHPYNLIGRVVSQP